MGPYEVEGVKVGLHAYFEGHWGLWRDLEFRAQGSGKSDEFLEAFEIPVQNRIEALSLRLGP